MCSSDTEQFSLRWDNFSSNIRTEFHALLEAEDLVDVTLASDGCFIKAHKIVLSVCSPYFKALFKVNPCKHPIVILKDVHYRELVNLLGFMYTGEVNVSQQDLPAFLKTAELLQVKGLASNNNEKNTLTSSHANITNGDLKESPGQEVKQDVPLKRRRVEELHSDPSTSDARLTKLNNSAVRLLDDQSDDDDEDDEDCSSINDDETNLFDEDIKPTKEFLDMVQVEISQSQVDLIGVGRSTSCKRIRDFSSRIEDWPKEDTGQDGSERSKMMSIPDNLTSRSPRSCPLCPRLFLSRNNLLVHIKNEHGHDRGPFRCDVCGRVAKNKNSLRVHMYLYHRDCPQRLNQQS